MAPKRDQLALEKLFERESENKASFPRMELDYNTQYEQLVNYLEANIYKDIDAGLASNSAEAGFYTAHNAEHFKEVVRYAGDLLGVKNGQEKCALSPYELYILLVAIRIHDAGNIYGREKHEKQCFTVLRNCGGAAGDDAAEKKKISDIAQAHGGKTAQLSKDTISLLDEQTVIGNGTIRPRLLASILRFADEICESRCRAANYLVQFGSLPPQSEIYHQYAASISGNFVSADRRIILEYTIPAKDVLKPWGNTKSEKVFLIDTIFERLEKMDKERRYCNRFSREIYTIDSIRASIKVVNEELDPIETITVPELSDSGYPEDAPHVLSQAFQQYCTPEFRDELKQKIAGCQP